MYTLYMFYQLPEQTFYEIQRASRRKTLVLLGFMSLLYFLAFFLIIEITVFFIPFVFILTGFKVSLFWKIIILAAVSITSTYFHYQYTINKVIPNLPIMIGANVLQPKDSYHRNLINIKDELCAATGIYNVHTGIISSTAMNALAVSDGKDVNYVIVTEGLIARLDKNELEAVVAHEFSHLLNGDAVLTTLACSLFGIFEQILKTLKNAGANTKTKLSFAGRIPVSGTAIGFLYFAVIKLICLVTIFISRIITVFISRQREMLADATAVQLTKNPMGLAEALYKISRKWNGGGLIAAPGLFPLFILNPVEDRLDESEGIIADLFSTHPPLQKRLNTLLDFAKDNIESLHHRVESEQKQNVVPAAGKWWVWENESWAGPFLPGQINAVSSIFPLSWICRDGTKEVKRLKDEPVLFSMLNTEPGKDSPLSEYSCPRCNVKLVKDRYEEADVEFCLKCKGYLVSEKSIVKILSRNDQPVYEDILKELEVMQASHSYTKKPTDIDKFPQCSCPKCNTVMKKTFYSSRIPMVVDKCSRCSLAWFDEKELEYLNSLGMAEEPDVIRRVY